MEIWVFNLGFAYRDKKVVGVFVRFSCATSSDSVVLELASPATFAQPPDSRQTSG
jgi:hypothetical protein